MLKVSDWCLLTCVKCGDDPRNGKCDMILSPAKRDRRSRFSVSIINSLSPRCLQCPSILTHLIVNVSTMFQFIMLLDFTLSFTVILSVFFSWIFFLGWCLLSIIRCAYVKHVHLICKREFTIKFSFSLFISDHIAGDVNRLGAFIDSFFCTFQFELAVIVHNSITPNIIESFSELLNELFVSADYCDAAKSVITSII